MEKEIKMALDDIQKPLTKEQMGKLFTKKEKEQIININQKFITADKSAQILAKEDIEQRLSDLEEQLNVLNVHSKVEEMTDEEYKQYRTELLNEYESLSGQKALLQAKIKYSCIHNDIKPIAAYSNEAKTLSDVQSKNDLPELKEKLLQILFLKKRLEHKEKALRQRISYLKLHDSQIEIPYLIGNIYSYIRSWEEDDYHRKPIAKKGVCKINDIVIDAISEDNAINVSFVDVNDNSEWTSTCFTNGVFMDGLHIEGIDSKPFTSEVIDDSPEEETTADN
jgi:hypothetical protein